MAKVFAIANQKGGVGKTTTCINLAASLVATKRRVLLIDLDPQGNATMGSGVDKHGLENSVYDLLIGECDLAQAMHYSEHGGYQLLPANRDLTAAEVVLLEMQMKESRLAERGAAPVLVGIREGRLPAKTGVDGQLLGSVPGILHVVAKIVIAKMRGSAFSEMP